MKMETSTLRLYIHHTTLITFPGLLRSPAVGTQANPARVLSKFYYAEVRSSQDSFGVKMEESYAVDSVLLPDHAAKHI